MVLRSTACALAWTLWDRNWARGWFREDGDYGRRGPVLALLGWGSSGREMEGRRRYLLGWDRMDGRCGSLLGVVIGDTGT